MFRLNTTNLKMVQTWHSSRFQALTLLKDGRIQGSLLPQAIQWSFSPPASSNFGDLLRSVLQLLHSPLYQKMINNESLQTIFCMQSQSLTTVLCFSWHNTTDSKSHPSTTKTAYSPAIIFLKSDLYARNHWKHAQYMANLFWHRQIKKISLAAPGKAEMDKNEENLSVGNVVLVVHPQNNSGS